MQHFIQEVQLHWPEIALALLFIWSETLGLNPKYASSSVAQVLIPFLKKASQPEMDKLQK